MRSARTSTPPRRPPPSLARRARRACRACRAGAPALIALAVALGVAPTAAAQRAQPEFTRQGLLIPTFAVDSGVDRDLGPRVADEVRGRLEDRLPGREVDVIGGGRIRTTLNAAGFDPRVAPDEVTLAQLGQNLRVDELLEATVSTDGGAIRVRGQLVLMRDRRLRQPLPVATGRDADEVGEQFARAVAAARAQLVPQRRCENHLRSGEGASAIRAAREGIAAYPDATLARTCLVLALRTTGAPATQILGVANEILARDSVNGRALEAAGIALDSLRRRAEAARVWTRLAATDTANLELTERVIWALYENENAAAAEPLVVRATAAHPDTLRLVQLQWRVANATRNWRLVASTGETLLARDSLVARDSGFVYRLAGAYEATDRPYHALATAALGVHANPESGRLFALYARLVRGEADSVLPRGVARFPRNAELLALQASVLRAEGRIAEALTATRQAVALDPLLPQGELAIAQAELDLGRPDSALAALHRLVDRTADAPAVAVPDPAGAAGAAPTLAADAPPPTPATPGSSDTPAAASNVADAVVRPPSIGARTAESRARFAGAQRDSVRAMVAAFALAKGNGLLRAADATRSADGYRLAAGFLTLADSIAATPTSRLLVGMATFGLANAAMTAGAEAGADERCARFADAARQSAAARLALEAGRSVSEEAAAQYLGYLTQIDGFVQAQLAAGCTAPPAAMPPPG